MLKRIRSSIATFNEVPLLNGMNVILADRAEDSDETESTNGLGKSTFVRIVHFCLGSDFGREKVLSHPQLKGATFFLDFDWNSFECTVSRGTTREKYVRVTSKFIEGLHIESTERLCISFLLRLNWARQREIETQALVHEAQGIRLVFRIRRQPNVGHPAAIDQLLQVKPAEGTRNGPIR